MEFIAYEDEIMERWHILYLKLRNSHIAAMRLVHSKWRHKLNRA